MVLRWIGLFALLAALAWIFVFWGDGGAELAQAEPRSTPDWLPAQAAELVEAESERREAVEVPQRSSASAFAVDEREAPSELATLSVLVVAPDGTPWSDARVHVMAGPQSLSGVRFEMTPRSDGSWRHNRMGSDVLGSDAIADVDDQGCARLRRITPGVALDVRAVDVLGTVGARAERVVLAAGEQRALELKLETFPRELRGRCADERGIGLAGAEVRIRVAVETEEEPAPTLRARSDDLGEFRTSELLASRLTLQASHTGRIAAAVVDTAVHSGFVELLLAPSRSLRVEVRGSAGETLPDVRVSVHETTGEELFDTPQNQDKDGIMFTALPRRPLELRWGSRCAPQSRMVPEHVDHVVVSAPRSGDLQLSVGALPGDERTRYAVQLHCTDAQRAAAQPCSFFNDGRFESSWTLAPGHYALELVRLPSHAAEQVLVWGDRLSVELRAGETTHARLGQ